MYRKYFQLSKATHPDRNPNNPHAAERFAKISEAYATLSNAQRRERYDRENFPAANPKTSGSPRGSYSSAASTPFGSRPATGLSRRRTQFRGPPPSFYRNGAWGAQRSRRQAQAQGSSEGPSGPSESTSGGFSPGQAHRGMNNVPHFDQAGHLRNQQSQEEKRRRRDDSNVSDYDVGSAADMALRFALVSGIIAFACIPIWLLKKNVGNGNTKHKQLKT